MDNKSEDEEGEEDEYEKEITSPVKVKKVLTTGKTDIDRKMGSGIPVGSLTLIEGPNDSGKSVLSQQIIWGALHNGITFASYTTENTAKSLLTQMDSLALDVSDYFILGKLKIYPINVKGVDWSEDIPFLDYISEDIRRKNTEVIIIDSLTVFVSHASENEILNFFNACKGICDSGTTIIVTVHKFALEEEMLTRIRSICDAHLSLSMEEMGNKLVRTLTVAKIRGATKTTGNITGFEVDPEFGLRIIPISKAQM